MGRIVVLLGIFLAICCCAAIAEAEYLRYKDPKQPLNTRIKDLLKRMTLEEKVGQMTQIDRTVASADVMKKYFIGSILSGGGSVPAPKASPQVWVDMVNGYQKGSLSTRLGIPLIYGIDAVHGHNNVYKATIFPHNVGLGVTRDPQLIKRIGEATALEVRATGIQYAFAPCIAVCRDPRWGRCYESYSEDHKIVQAMTEIISGLQGEIPTNSRKGAPYVAGKTKVAACAKHYLGDGGTTKGINENNTLISGHGLFSIHMPAYYNAVIKGVSTVMISYSSWNGVKMHSNHELITNILKKTLRFRGFVISDWEGIDRMTTPPHANYTWSILTSINAGLDMKWDLLYSTTATSKDSLYRRILPRGRSKESIVPVLDQWIDEGRDVHKRNLRYIVRELRRYDQFKAALEVSEWMSDKRSIKLGNRDMAARLDLISKLYGTEKAEDYFNSIPPEYKDGETYGILLNCYARSNSVEKAEATVQKMKEFGFMTRTSSYNVLLNLYRQTGDNEKLKAVLSEMEEKGVGFDKFTFGTVLTAYANASDIAGMNKILQLIESNPNAALDWSSYSIAANAFIKAGDTEKALEMLKKSEELIVAVNAKGNAYDSILSVYSSLGRKDEVYRVWEVRKKAEKPQNMNYVNVISLLLKLDDIKGAEKIFEEWESSGLPYIIKMPNLLVRAYCKKGLMDKAKECIDRAVSKGAIPVANTWYYMVLGYVNSNQMSKAVEAMKLAASAESKRGFKPTGCLAACLEYLKQKGDAEEAGEFLGSLLSNGIITAEIHDRLLFYVKKSKLAGDDVPVENRSALEILKG